MQSTLSHYYNQGLADEKLVKAFLRAKGLKVVEPTTDQDRLEDTDCFVNGVAVSIKAEHSGLRYGNIYFELAQQLTTHKDCEYSKSIVKPKADLKPQDVADLVNYGSWALSWYHNGKAPLYYIYQGDRLKIYKKADIVEHVARHGWLRIRALSAYRSSYLGGKYRYCNAICGFLDAKAIPHLEYTLVLNK